MKINENTLAKKVAEREGGKSNVTIAQIKEVIKCTADIVASEHTMAEGVEWLERHKGDVDEDFSG